MLTMPSPPAIVGAMARVYRAELNGEQYDAVTSEGGPLLNIAGGRSGKARDITFRIA